MARAEHGQSTMEMLLTIVFVIGALIVMARYVQRAYQGYLYSNSSTHGVQFDPTKDFTVTHRFARFRQTQDIDFTVRPGPVDIGPTGLPVSPLTPRLLRSTVRARSEWDITREGFLQQDEPSAAIYY